MSINRARMVTMTEHRREVAKARKEANRDVSTLMFEITKLKAKLEHATARGDAYAEAIRALMGEVGDLLRPKGGGQ